MSFKITYRKRDANKGIAADLKELDEFIHAQEALGIKVQLSDWEGFQRQMYQWKQMVGRRFSRRDRKLP